jgi:hypothetical protein
VVSFFGAEPLWESPPTAPGRMAGITEMTGHLRLQRAFEHGFGQFIEQTIRAIDGGSRSHRVLDQRIQRPARKRLRQLTSRRLLRTSRPMSVTEVLPACVRTVLQSVYDQPDTESVVAQYNQVLDTLAGELPRR